MPSAAPEAIAIRAFVAPTVMLPISGATPRRPGPGAAGHGRDTRPALTLRLSFFFFYHHSVLKPIFMAVFALHYQRVIVVHGFRNPYPLC